MKKRAIPIAIYKVCLLQVTLNLIAVYPAKSNDNTPDGLGKT